MAVISADSGAKHYVWGGICDGWHLVETSDLSVIQESMPPNTSEVPHRHLVARQFFFVLNGTLSIAVPGAVHQIAANQGLEIAPGTPHRVFYASQAHVKFLVISAPASHGDRESFHGALEDADS